ncbi:MAG: Na+/H+ antiporter [Deltaproteobacteria bacterium]|nr:Na+/H+ antiporter [Deltaproteobacteria bacterium]
MDDVFTIFVLLLAVAGSAVARRFVPWRAPMPLLQIACGALLALPFLGLQIGLDPELFLLLIISPLLFADASRISKREFLAHLKPTSLMALSLVLATVLGLGAFIAWLVPLPLPIAMALGAILSPTDAVAVAAMTGRSALPRKVAHLLEGEGLLNDASGLVAFKFALAAAVTGSFSALDAGLSFLAVAVGGLVLGLAVGWAVSAARRKIAQWNIDEPALSVALLLLTPFAAYLVAERFHASGILASVAAGLVTSTTGSNDASSTADRLLGRSVWAMLEFVFNGVSFVLLGLQLPEITHRISVAAAAGTLAWLDCIAYVVAITATLFAVRFVWCSLHLRGRTFRHALGLAPPDRALSRAESHAERRTTFPHLVVLTLAGVRGSVTLAAALSLPLTLGDAPFPARDLLLFIAAGVILMTLAVGAIVLPIAVRKLPADDPSELEDRRRLARLRVAEAAVASLAQTAARLAEGKSPAERRVLTEIAQHLTAIYSNREAAESADPDIHRSANLFKEYGRDLRLSAVRAERDTLRAMQREHLIDDDLMRELMMEVDLAETWLLGSLASPRAR